MLDLVTWRHARGVLAIDRPIVVGILNVTPDSFSDGGQLSTVEQALERATEMVAAGADVLDVGGESTRPQGASAVSQEEELRRVIPVIQALARDLPNTPISVDTVKSVVAERALGAGAAIVNDVSAFRLDARMAAVCAAAGAGVVLMHSRGGVSDMATYAHAVYDSVVDDVVNELGARIEAARAAGVSSESLIIDPGIGFSKRSEQSLAIIAGLSHVVALGYPVLVGASRKRFIGELTGESVPSARLIGTVAVHVAALERGARLFRVHDVGANRQALDVVWAVMNAAPVTAAMDGGA
jgi:dihydropteroate synthase